MGDEARLVVQVSNQGINETTTMLQILANQSRNTEIAIKNLTDAMLKHTTGQKQHAIANKETGDSFGSLALKIAGYSTALNLGVSVTRRALTELKDLGVQAITLAGSFERSRVAWGVFLKDVEAGSQMFDRLYDVAQRTPLTFQGVESAAQMLKGFGLATEEIIPTLERMGDVARGNDETMQRLALAYGQALAQNRVLTRDLYQFVNAGVPIFEALAQVMEKSVHQVGILVSEGKVGFPEIEKALKALTEEGGQFHGMMEKTAETFEGKLSIAADNFKAVLSTIGREVIPTLKTALDELNTTMDTMISKSNALYYLRTGQGDPNSLIAGLKTIMERNSAAAENPLTKLTGFNWNIFHTAPDGGWQPLYGPKYENELLQGLIDRIQAQQAESGYGKAEQNRQGYRTASVPVASDRVPWRDVLVGQKIQAYERPWVPTDQGTMVRGNLLSGTDLVTQFLEQQKLGFENVKGTKFEEEFRKEFTRKADDLQQTLLASGLWKLGEATISVIDDYIDRYGWKKEDKDADPFKALQALYTKGAKGQSGIAPPGDWSNVPSIAEQMEAMGYVQPPNIDDMFAYYARLPGAKGQSGIAPPGDWSNAPSIAEQMAAMGYDPSSAESRLALLSDPGNHMAEWMKGYTKYQAEKRAALPADFFGARWMMNPQYGTSEPPEWEYNPNMPAWGNPEAQQAALNAAMNAQQYRIGTMGRRYTDRYAGRTGFEQVQDPEAVAEALWRIQVGQESTLDQMSEPPSGVMADYLWNRASWISEKKAQEITPEQRKAMYEADYYGGMNKRGAMGLTAQQEQILFAASELSGSTAYGWDKPYVDRIAGDRGLEAVQNPDLVAFLRSGVTEYDPNEIYRRNREMGLVPQAGEGSWAALTQYFASRGASTISTDDERLRKVLNDPAKLLEMNMRAFEGAAPSGRWQERPIGINADTGDISGYTVQQAYTEAEKYQEAQDNLTLALANGEISAAGYNQALKDLAEQYDPLTKAAISFGDALRDTAINTFADELYNLGSALVSGADGWESFGDAMGNTLETLLQMLPKLAIQVGLSMLGNGNPADDPLAIGLIAGGLVGQVGVGMAKANAQGGVYASPSLHAYANNVYDKPQMFAFASGGIFAEAGPEAIMPLSRDSTGRLGVKSSGGGSVGVQIINQTSTPITGKAKTITDASGNRKLVLTIKELVKQEVATANAGGVRKS